MWLRGCYCGQQHGLGCCEVASGIRGALYLFNSPESKSSSSMGITNILGKTHLKHIVEK